MPGTKEDVAVKSALKQIKDLDKPKVQTLKKNVQELKKAADKEKDILDETLLTITPDEKELKEDKSKFNPDDELLTVLITNLESPGHEISVGCGPTKRPFKGVYQHGMTYTIPRWVVRHIEGRCTPVYAYTADGTGKRYKKLSHYKNRFSCKQVY